MRGPIYPTQQLAATSGVAASSLTSYNRMPSKRSYSKGALYRMFVGFLAAAGGHLPQVWIGQSSESKAESYSRENGSSAPQDCICECASSS